MFDRSKCDLCGDCPVKCLYVNDERYKALCFGSLRARTNLQKGLKIQNMNLTDAKEHSAHGVVFLYPICLMTLGSLSQERGLAPISLTDLCRMVLGEKSFP